MAQPATVFLGPDMEKPPMYRCLTKFFERLNEAERYAVDDILLERRWGNYIVVQDGQGRRIEWDEMEGAVRQLGGSPNSA
jgi:hypothetical protein